MTLALLDVPTGIAGNMLLAALLDLGVPEAVIHQPLAQLGLAGRYRLAVEPRRSGGLRGLHLAVEATEAEPGHRAWGALRPLLAEAPLNPQLRERVLAVFTLLAEAEAAVHGHAPEQVHFHEVGAIDALVDIVGVCAGLLHLGVEELVVGVPPAGHGTVVTAHGSLPLPAPAVLEIARCHGLPLGSSAGFPPGELTTPTGLALAAVWASRFGVAPAAVPLRVGVGLGSRSLDRPNLLRLVLARPLESPPAGAEPGAGVDDAAMDDEAVETVLVQEALIDDATPEDLAFLAEELRRAGAIEVFQQPALMKKGRQGTLITALVPPSRGGGLRRIWWSQGSSLGLREQEQRRWRLPRRLAVVPTPLGPVRVKWADRPGGARAKPEHDDLMALARRHDWPLERVRRVVMLAIGDPAIEDPTRDDPARTERAPAQAEDPSGEAP
ncbi:MAG: LarC family nickel insertion protein [Cyanobacteriota bacterium]|nr:LarC family nickel insertion protein [Cyanobacteriota bacterium]